MPSSKAYRWNSCREWKRAAGLAEIGLLEIGDSRGGPGGAGLLATDGERRPADGRASGVRREDPPECEVATGIKAVPMLIPRVRSRDGELMTVHSAQEPVAMTGTATFSLMRSRPEPAGARCLP